MTTTAFSIDSESALNSHPQIINFLEYISGTLHKESIVLLEAICLKNPSLLEKFIIKCAKQSLNIRARDFDLVVKALDMQVKLSNKIMPTIHAHLLDNKFNELANFLNMLVENLQEELPPTDVMQAIMKMIDNLKIFAKQNSDEKFIKSILLLMLNFYNKQTNDNEDSHYLDSAKWLESLLGISQRSSLIQLIKYIAIRIAIAKIKVHGVQKNIQLTKIFYIFDEMTQELEINQPATENKKIIRDINACIMLGMLCKATTHTMVDATVQEMQAAKNNILVAQQELYLQTSELHTFMTSNDFTNYYKYNPQLQKINTYAFFANFTKLFSETLVSSPRIELQTIQNFIGDCVTTINSTPNKNVIAFLDNLEIDANIIETFHKHCLPVLLRIQKLKISKTNSLNFIANKLVNLGFSPRSITYSNAGIFQPLVTKNKSSIDYKNLQALYDYLEFSNEEQRSVLIKDLIAILLISHTNNSVTLKNTSPKTPKKFLHINHFPMLTMCYHHALASNRSYKYPKMFYPKQTKTTHNMQINNSKIEGQ